jgi:hypothetical protein
MKLHVSRLMFTSLLTAVTACGGSSPSSPEDGRSAGTGDQAAGLTEIVEPTAEYYESVVRARLLWCLMLQSTCLSISAELESPKDMV